MIMQQKTFARSTKELKSVAFRLVGVANATGSIKQLPLSAWYSRISNTILCTIGVYNDLPVYSLLSSYNTNLQYVQFYAACSYVLCPRALSTCVRHPS